LLIAQCKARNMPRILSFTTGPHDWQALLADPAKHWRTGYSARTLAHCWEAADGFPQEIAKALSNTTDPLLAGLVPILAVPEFKVPLPGGARSSQNDLFVLGRSLAGPVSLMVEGKVSESFGPTLEEWQQDMSPGKVKRLKFLVQCLGLNEVPRGDVRYQLLHRAASALITGEQYRAVAAVLLIHSFSEGLVGWSDYAVFTGLFGVKAARGIVQRLTDKSTIPLFGAWVVGDCTFLRS
jgi:hypothetical protein